MKKIFFAICIVSACTYFFSCAGEGGCSLSGTWKVAEVNIESESFSERIINSMERDYLKSSYTFNKDGSMSIDGQTGKYTFEPELNILRWTDDESRIENLLQVTSCSASAFELVQRMPVDETQPATAVVSFKLVPQ